MKVEIFADVVCPWCYVGERRVERALAALPYGDDIEVVYRPYQLHPAAPETAVPVRDYLARRFGSMAGRMMARVSEAAAPEGIVMNWDRALSVNTRAAHRLMRLAREEYDADVQRALLNELFAAHFTHGGNVADHAQLAELAVSVGINRQRVRDYLASEEGREELQAELDQARRLRVESVPSFIFDEQYLVEGAQPVATFVRVLEEVERRGRARAVHGGDRSGGM